MRIRSISIKMSRSFKMFTQRAKAERADLISPISAIRITDGSPDGYKLLSGQGRRGGWRMTARQTSGHSAVSDIFH